jgi:hypothetical protein
MIGVGRPIVVDFSPFGVIVAMKAICQAVRASDASGTMPAGHWSGGGETPRPWFNAVD